MFAQAAFPHSLSVMFSAIASDLHERRWGTLCLCCCGGQTECSRSVFSGGLEEQPVTEVRCSLIIVQETLVTLILDKVVKLDTAQTLSKLAINRVNATFRTWCSDSWTVKDTIVLTLDGCQCSVMSLTYLRWCLCLTCIYSYNKCKIQTSAPFKL